MLRKGDVINGYTILQDSTTAGGGMCEWTFAGRDGVTYFLKEFKFPTYPAEGTPGSPETKALKRRQCQAFESHQRKLIEQLRGRSGDGGNLIVAHDFFRAGAKYYKVTQKVDVAGLKPADVAALPLARRVLVMKTVAHSLRILRSAGIVHGDLKPDNILIKLTAEGFYTGKLIDFDNSFFSGRPPAERNELVGDLAYYSPEMARYIQEQRGSRPADLTLASDIFALGLIFCEYLAGRKPAMNPKYHYASAAVEAGVTLRLGLPACGPDLNTLIEQMLRKDPAARPPIDAVFEALKKAPLPEEPRGEGSGLRGTLFGRRAAPAPPEPPPSPPPAPPGAKPRLTGSLARRKPPK